MSVTYTKLQREAAKAKGLHLVTLAAHGVEVQAPVTADERDRVLAFITDFLERRRESLKAASADARAEGGSS